MTNHFTNVHIFRMPKPTLIPFYDHFEDGSKIGDVMVILKLPSVCRGLNFGTIMSASVRAVGYLFFRPNSCMQAREGLFRPVIDSKCVYLV